MESARGRLFVALPFQLVIAFGTAPMVSRHTALAGNEEAFDAMKLIAVMSIAEPRPVKNDDGVPCSDEVKDAHTLFPALGLAGPVWMVAACTSAASKAMPVAARYTTARADTVRGLGE